MASPIDLSTLAREAKKSASTMRGVDLNVIRNKTQHQHRWILAINFAVEDKVMAEIATRMLQVKKLAEDADRAGIQLTEADVPPNVAIPTGNDNVVVVDGPGCIKCGIRWDAPEGYGALCPVNDQEFTNPKAMTPKPVQ